MSHMKKKHKGRVKKTGPSRANVDSSKPKRHKVTYESGSYPDQSNFRSRGGGNVQRRHQHQRIARPDPTQQQKQHVGENGYNAGYKNKSNPDSYASRASQVTLLKYFCLLLFAFLFCSLSLSENFLSVSKKQNKKSRTCAFAFFSVGFSLRSKA